MTPDLTARYLGLELRSPLVASASPLTARLDHVRRLEAAGAGAIVLPSLFEEQITRDALDLDMTLESGAESFPEALSYFPEATEYVTVPDQYLDHLQAAKGASGVPVIASLNGSSRGGWVQWAHRLQEAGADALELNVYTVAADPGMSGRTVEDRVVELVESVREAVRIPLAVKLGPFYSSMPEMARRVVEAGADGLVLFNRFYQPDFDLETLEVVPRLVLSSSDELRLPLRWIAILHGQVECSLAATTGVHTAEDAVKVILAGANVAMLTSALLLHGPEHLATVETDLVRWMSEHEYESVEQLRGSMSQRAVPDPEAFERANYLRMLTSYPAPD
ncbi:MAG TPA: dihydroorotate dehydrogenase-like protein [Actinomycetota bacterium]